MLNMVITSDNKDKRLDVKESFYQLTLCLLVLTDLQIILANSLDPDQAGQNVGPDRKPNCLTLTLLLKDFFEKS